MIQRPAYLKLIAAAVRRSPVTALMGPRQCGKTTLARMFQQGKKASFLTWSPRPTSSGSRTRK